MAMTKCKECETDISTTADACPKCGAKQIRTSGCAKIVAICIGLLILFYLIGHFGGDSSDRSTPATSSSASSASSPVKSLHPLTPAPVVGSQWNYGQSQDPMSGAEGYGAAVLSSNTVSFDFPYSGAQHATMMLRSHPRHGKAIVLQIEQGQFLCRSYEDCIVLVRFDDQKPEKYSAVGPSDNSTETIFIRNYSRFVGNMLKAKRVRISAEIYQEGAPVFEFDVTGFDESKYKPKK